MLNNHWQDISKDNLLNKTSCYWFFYFFSSTLLYGNFTKITFCNNIICSYLTLISLFNTVEVNKASGIDRLTPKGDEHILLTSGDLSTVWVTSVLRLI